MRKFFAVVTSSYLAPLALAGAAQQPLTVAHVDLARYSGTWYEIAAIPQPFEKGCVGSQAEYAVVGEGQLRIINSCHQGSALGPVRSVEGNASAIDASGAKLKVTFDQAQGSKAGDYWILGLDPGYQYALVGTPDRQALWILDRSPHPSAAIIARLTDIAASQGFDVDTLLLSPQ